MKKYNVEIKFDDEKTTGELQVKEEEIFIETDETIIQIPYSDIDKRSFTSKKGLEIETKNYSFCINGKAIDEINDKIKAKLHSKKALEEVQNEDNENSEMFNGKTDDEILTEIFDICSEYIDKNKFLFLMTHKSYEELAKQPKTDEEVETLLNLSIWEFFFGLYKYILEKIDKSEKTENFFRNLFPDVIDEFNELLKNNDKSLVNYNYTEHLQNIMAWFASIEHANDLNIEGIETLPHYDDFKLVMKQIESTFNQYVKPKKKLNIFLNKSIEKDRTSSSDKILQEVLKKFNKFNQENKFLFIANHKFHDGFNAAIENNDDEKIDQFLSVVTVQFYLSLFIYVYNNIDNSEKTIEFFKNLYPELVCEEITKDQEKLVELGWDSYPKHLNNIIAHCMKMKKFRENCLAKGEKIDEKSYALYDEFEPYMLFLEESYNNYVNPEKKLDIMLNHKSNNINENNKQASKIIFFGYYLPISLIILMVIMFFKEFLGDHGIIMEGGWFSIIFFIALIIWAAIGYDGKRLTCRYCGKFNSLKLTSDTIIESRDTWKTKTEYVNNRSYQKQVAVRVEIHERHYMCNNCHNETVRFENEEHEL